MSPSNSIAVFATTMLAASAQAYIGVVDSLPITSGYGVNTGETATFATGYSISETGNDNLLVVFYSAYTDSTSADPAASSVTFGGVTLTQARQVALEQPGAGYNVTGIFYLTEDDFASVSGSDLVFSRSSGSNPGDDGAHYSIMLLSGVDQSAPIGQSDYSTTTTNNTALSVELSSLEPNSVVLSSFSATPDGTFGSDVNLDSNLAGALSDGSLTSLFALTNVDESTETMGATFSSSESSGRSAMLSVEVLAAVPEPETYALMLGLASLGLLLMRRR
ncbi:PEP-CTERM sorting domain-containing protein [Cerasicoccus frondis]|uniref:PEP-CTERM sorting domain-containing protein n=1 Tax=Cerasicoccus frondis TaxID=490090 RepID=UPI0028529A5C|nr:PEP-CTERM sorting domain-containing protein [Cerasicoccus frondis]